MAEPLNINFRWVSNAQKPSAGGVETQIKNTSAGIARILVNEVAISAAESAYKEARRSLVSNIERIVKAEVQRMAKNIAGNLLVQDPYRGPYGTLNLQSDDFNRGSSGSNDSGLSNAYFNQLSETARNTPGFRSTFNLQSAGIKWTKRSRAYMRWKRRNGKAGWWWKKSGSLQSYLKNSVKGDFYERAFGPVKVFFTRTKVDGNSVNNLTMSGLGGKISRTVTVGRLEVVAFGRITPSIMPGLASMVPESNPLPHMGVAQLLAQRYPRNRQIMKLIQRGTSNPELVNTTRKRGEGILGRVMAAARRKKQKAKQPAGHYRPALDPFVSFYLTRAIPNAVWRRTERFVQRKAYVRSNTSGKGYDV